MSRCVAASLIICCILVCHVLQLGVRRGGLTRVPAYMYNTRLHFMRAFVSSSLYACIRVYTSSVCMRYVSELCVRYTYLHTYIRHVCVNTRCTHNPAYTCTPSIRLEMYVRMHDIFVCMYACMNMDQQVLTKRRVHIRK